MKLIFLTLNFKTNKFAKATITKIAKITKELTIQVEPKSK